MDGSLSGTDQVLLIPRTDYYSEYNKADNQPATHTYYPKNKTDLQAPL